MGEAFAKAIGVVPGNEVSGGKLLKRRASHGNQQVKFHLLSAAKAAVLHGRGLLYRWFCAYRSRATYLKAVIALAGGTVNRFRMAEALWWVRVYQQPYR